MQSRLSVVMAVYNAPEDVALCLNSIARHVFGPAPAAEPETTESQSLELISLELILVDDASDQETAALLKMFAAQYPNHVTLLRNPVNQGYLHTINRGMAETRGDIVVLLNSDTVLPQHFAARIRDCFAANLSIGIAAPICSDSATSTVRMRPGSTVEAMQERAEKIPPTYPTLIFPAGFCFCIRRAVIDQCGFMDTAYSPGYYEETDYAMQAHKKGWTCALIDNLYVYHRNNASFSPATASAHTARNAQIFHARWGSEYAALVAAHPRKAMKALMYARFYSPWELLCRRLIRCLANLIPQPSLRAKVRAAYR